MVIVKKEVKLCPCCMEEHEVCVVTVDEYSNFKGKDVEFSATYAYCSLADEYYEEGDMSSLNDIAMKNAYRKTCDLLTTEGIVSIRNKYDITQTDLALLLGWGAKTITRYETHQVQDIAHDTILRKIDSDPEWFLSLLRNAREKFAPLTYVKYHRKAMQLFENAQDAYLRKSIFAQYARFDDNPAVCGYTKLNLDKVVDVVRYFSNAQNVINLYKVKLMKLLWYADALSFKVRGRSMMGLVYKALPMGAVPVAHESIIHLLGIRCMEEEFSQSTAYHFLPTESKEYTMLTNEDIDILERVAASLGSLSKDALIDYMHEEDAYVCTELYSIIPYKYAETLSI